MGKCDIMENFRNNYYAFTQSEYLQQYAKTDKPVLPDFSNIDELDEQEYITLMRHFLSYLTATNVPIIITGICYLRLMYDNSSRRFKEHVFHEIDVSGLSLDDEDDYNQLSTMFILCDFDLYQRFLRERVTSCNQDIKSDAKENLAYTKEYFEKAKWYQSYVSEYTEFRRKLFLDT